MYHIRLYATEASKTTAIRRRAIRFLRKEFPTLGVSRIHPVIHNLAYKPVVVFRSEAKHAEIDLERARKIVARLEELGIKAKEIEVKWDLME